MDFESHVTVHPSSLRTLNSIQFDFCSAHNKVVVLFLVSLHGTRRLVYHPGENAGQT